MTPESTDWKGLYREGWTGIISPESFSHPAKFARGLIRKIYQHALSEGWLKPGDTVVDPFAGVALGALDAMQAGLNWIGVELESSATGGSPFVELGQGMDCPGFDKDFWRRYHGRGGKWIRLGICPDCGSALNGGTPWMHWFGTVSHPIPNREPHRYKGNIEWWQWRYKLPGTARLIQGDSRELSQVIERSTIEATISSPPYNPPFSQEHNGSRGGQRGTTPSEEGAFVKYGNTPGQLEGLSMTDEGLDAAISSPPYVGSLERKGGIDPSKSEYLGGPHSQMNNPDTRYGDSSGQLGTMKPGDLDAAIGSPPYADARIPQEGGSNIDNIRRPNDRGRYSAVIGSPPYAGNDKRDFTHGWRDPLTQGSGGFRGTYSSTDGGVTPGQIGDMPTGDFDLAISSPPFLQTAGGTNVTSTEGPLSDPRLIKRHAAGNAAAEGYGESDANLGNLKPGELDAAISSPPFTDSLQTKDTQFARKRAQDHAAETGRNYQENWERSELGDYGSTPGQLGGMKTGGLDAALSSPPFSGSMVESGDPAFAHKFHGSQKEYGASRYQLHNEFTYMSPEWIEERRRQSTGANIARLPEEAKTVQTFWEAARQITEQTYITLRPGGHAIWVVKAFVKKHELVDFPDQWRQLCEAVGFRTCHIHWAHVVEDKGNAVLLMDHGEHKSGDKVRLTGMKKKKINPAKVERKSFFRRLAEKNGSPEINFEVVLCMEKPS